VADLRFFFWQKMFTARHDARLWDRHLPRVLPTLEDDSLTGRPARSVVHDELERIRGLRNRIAHHEPIFGRALADDYARLRRVIAWRCPIGAGWTDRAQGVEALLFAGPAGVPL